MAVFQNDRHVFANQAYCALLGYASLFELRGKRLEDIFAPTDLSRFTETYSRCLSEGECPASLRLEMLRSDGSPLVVEFSAERSAFEDHPALQAFVQVSNGSAAFPSSEASLPEAELAVQPPATEPGTDHELFDQIFHRSQAVKLLVDAQDGRIIGANSAAAAFYGYSCETLQAMELSQIARLMPQEINALLLDLREGRLSRFRQQQRTAQGELRDVEVFVGPLELAGRRALHFIVVDVTDRTRVERSLQEQEENYRRLVETSRDLIFTLDSAGNWTYVNEAARLIYGLPREELLGKSFSSFSSDDCIKHDREMLERVAAGENVLHHKTEHLRADGSHVSLSFNVTPVADSAGGGVAGTASDVSEEQEAKRALEESERNYKNLFQNAGDAIIVTTLGGIIVSYNQKAEEILLCSEYELHGANIATIEHSQFARNMEMLIVQVRQHGSAFFETMFKRGDNTLIDAEVTVRLAQWQRENSLLVFVRDVSARKRAEAALRQTETNHRALLDSIRSPVVALNEELKVQYCNEAFAEFVRTSSEELRMMLLTELFPEFAGTEAYAAILSVLEDGQSRVVEGEADGYIYNATIYRTPLGIIATFEDVTDRRFVDMALKEYRKHLEQVIEERTAEINEINRRLKDELEQRQKIEAELRKARDELEERVLQRTQALEEANASLRHEVDVRSRAEEAVRERENYLNLIVNTAPVFLVALDNQGRIILSLGRALERMGIRPWESAGESIFELAASYPAILEMIRSSLAGKELADALSIGAAVYQFIATPIRDETSSVRGVVLLGIDISERKRAEEALRDSEERYRELVQNMGEGITVVDQNEHFIFANPAADRLFGVDRGKLVGRGISEFTTAEEFARISKQTELRRKGIAGTYEMEIRRGDGELRHHQVTVNPYFDDRGNYIGAHAITVDITERVLAEIAMRESEERYRRLVELSPVGIFVHVDGHISFVNSSGAAMLGAASAQELIGQPTMSFVHAENVPRVAERLKRIVAEQSEAPLATEKFVRLDGTVIEVELGAIPMAYEGRQAVQLVVRDITERVKLQEQLFQQQKEESIVTLAGGVAHDFNNILIGVLGSASLLRETLSPGDPGVDLCDTIRVAAERMTDLTTKLLAYARGGKHDPRPLSTVRALEDTLVMLRGNLLPTVSVQRELVEGTWPIYADAGQLNQVLINLIINANEAMNEKGGTLTVRCQNQSYSEAWRSNDLHAMPAGDFVHISVSDTGMGMSEETRARVFEPFFSTKFRGRGLGLAAARGIVRNHGGSIFVESEPGHGSTFHLILPRSQSEPEVEASASVREHSVGATILLVDDEALILKVAGKILSNCGYKVLSAPDAEAGLAIFAEHADEISLVIADLQMPGMDGWEMVRRIREQRPQVKVALCSGYDESAVIDREKQGKIDGFIKKPYDSKILSSRVRDLLADTNA